MEKAEFERELNKYRRVREKTHNDVEAWIKTFRAKRAASGAVGASTSGEQRGADGNNSSSVEFPETSLIYDDFWVGLDAMLSLHITDPAKRAKVTKALDVQHFALLKEMNLEDMEDVATIFRGGIPSSSSVLAAESPPLSSTGEASQ